MADRDIRTKAVESASLPTGPLARRPTLLVESASLPTVRWHGGPRYWGLCASLLLTLFFAQCSWAAPRFPPPEFESGHKMPELTFQTKSTVVGQYLYVGVMLLALVLATWLVHRKRSRVGIFVLGIFSLLYFGFHAKGCVCPIGSIQNFAAALYDWYSPIPLPILALFVLPLVFALLYGRVFCGSVCPLGAIQDLFIFKAIRVPLWLEGSLGSFRFFYLGLAIYFTLSLNRFIICEYDPFVSFFRFNGPLFRFLLGVILLLLGLIIARPYCRYLCPYGALLGLFSRWTNVAVSITPDECRNCTLCDAACPFEAIRRSETSQKTSILLKVTFVFLALGAMAGLTFAGYYFLGNNWAGLCLGGWFGLVLASQILGAISRKENPRYGVDPASCLACGRCYQACPMEARRIGKTSAVRPE